MAVAGYPDAGTCHPAIAGVNPSSPEPVRGFPDQICGCSLNLIVASEAEAQTALSRLHALDRQLIRARFEQRFSSIAMARNYLSLYERLCVGRDDLAMVSA